MNEERLRGERNRQTALASKLALDVAERDSVIEQYQIEIDRLRAEVQTVHAHLQHYRTLVDGIRAEKAELLAALRQARQALHYVGAHSALREIDAAIARAEGK